MTRVGLVLGGGGVVGQAYHSGVLAVLQNDLGFDARTADLIVGTSAGSITGALLRLGISAENLAAWTVKAPLHLAIGASCAVPGYFAPVQVGRQSYLDGGVHSPTNAAILRGQGLDVVVVIAPMSGPTGWQPGFFPAARRYSERLLQQEVRALRAEGIATVVFTPGAGEQQVMGTDMMSRARLDEVVSSSYLAAGRHAAAPEVADILHRATG